MSSEIKLEVAEIVAASQAGRVLALTPEGVPVWVDITTLQKQTFQNWLNENPDIVGYWWPDKFNIDVIAKSQLRAADFNSQEVEILKYVDGVGVYSPVDTTNENLRFSTYQTDQVSVEHSEIGFFYFDPVVVREVGDMSLLMYCSSTANFQGFQLWRADNIDYKWRITSYAYPYGNVSASVDFATDDEITGWVMLHKRVIADVENNKINLFLTVSDVDLNGYGAPLNGVKESNINLFRVSPTYGGPAITHAGSCVYPAFYAKSRRALTDVEATEIFEKFKAEYGIV